MLVLAVLSLSCATPPPRQEGTDTVTRRSIEQVLQANSDSLLARPGVVGTAIGLCDGTPCIRIFVAESSVAAGLADSLEGYPVRVEVTGPYRPRGDTG